MITLLQRQRKIPARRIVLRLARALTIIVLPLVEGDRGSGGLLMEGSASVLLHCIAREKRRMFEAGGTWKAI